MRAGCARVCLFRSHERRAQKRRRATRVQDAPGAAQNHSACMRIVVGCYRVSFCAVVCVNAESTQTLMRLLKGTAAARTSISWRNYLQGTRCTMEGKDATAYFSCAAAVHQSCSYATEPCQDVFNLKLAMITRNDGRNEHWARATLAVHSLYTQ